MSRSNPKQSTNPAEFFIEWNSTNGYLEYWDKALKQRVPVAGFVGIVLDQLHTITGYKKPAGGIWSNEVRDLSTEELHIRTADGVIYEGFYSGDGKDIIKGRGGKYTKSVYLYAKWKGFDGGLVNMKLTGGALGSWIDGFKGRNIENEDVGIYVAGTEPFDVDGRPFLAPRWSAKPIAIPETLEAATEADRVLQAHLTAYLQGGSGGGDVAADHRDDDPAVRRYEPAHETQAREGAVVEAEPDHIAQARARAMDAWDVKDDDPEIAF